MVVGWIPNGQLREWNHHEFMMKNLWQTPLDHQFDGHGVEILNNVTMMPNYPASRCRDAVSMTVQLVFMMASAILPKVHIVPIGKQSGKSIMCIWTPTAMHACVIFLQPWSRQYDYQCDQLSPGWNSGGKQN